MSPMCLPVVWTVSGPATITGGQGTSQLSFSATGTGSVHLVATSGNYIAETDIAIGIVKTPTMLNFNGFNYSEQNTGSICLGGYADYEVSVVDAVAYTTYWWSVSGAADFRFGQGSNAMGMTVEDEPGSHVYLTVQPENNCGLGDALNLTLQICGEGLGVNKTNVFVLSPNPASGMITIQKNRNSIEQNTKQDPGKTVITEVKIFDNMGTLMKQIKYGKETTLAQVNLAGLKKGIYYVEISTGKTKERQQLIIQK